MNLRVVAAEKYQLVRVEITLYTQLELVENMQHFVRNSGDERVLSYFTDTNGSKAMLMMSVNPSDNRKVNLSARCYEEFKEKIASGPHIVVQTARVEELFLEAAQFCERRDCKIGYTFVSHA